jgi:hypothetical protein
MDWSKFGVINIVIVIIYIIIATGVFNSSNPEFVYDFNERVEFNEVIAGPNDSIVVAGTVNGATYEDGRDAFVGQIDSSGNLVWSQKFGGAGDDQFYSIAKTSDGVVVAGSNTKALDLSTDAYLVKVDFSGEILWERIFNNQFSSSFHDLQVDDKGNLIMAGELEYLAEEDQLNTNAYVVKTDSKGTRLWTEKFGATNFTAARAIVGNSTSGFNIAGYTNNDRGQKSWLLKLNSDGEKVWAKDYFGTGTSSFYDLEQLKTGDFIAVGEANKQNNNGYIIKLDQRGAKIWDKVVEQGKKSYSSFQTVTELAGGQIIAGGVVSAPIKFGNLNSISYKDLIYAIQINQEGKKVSEYKFAKDRLGSLVGSAQINDNQFALVGNLSKHKINYRSYLTILEND